MRRTAFTLVELLVVVAIIALLLGLLLPAFGKARAVARETVAMSSMRQMLLGYQYYQNDHDGHVMWGYPPAMVDGRRLSVTLPSGHTLPGSNSALPVMRYPVRLAPYEGHVWELLYSHTQPPEAPRPGDSVEDAYTKAYQLSVNPSFGLNTVYLGGDIGFDGFETSAPFAPNRGGHVVFRAARVRQPSRLIVFADSKMRGGGVSEGDKGLHRVTPPHADGEQWRVVDGRFEIVNYGQVIGLPEGRYTDRTVTGFFDGHVEGLRPAQLDDMRLWANAADDVDYDYHTQ